MTAEPTIEQIAAAREGAGGRIPSAVVDAFVPTPAKSLGQRLVPLKAGHELVLSKIGHPLSTGKSWDDEDVLIALFVFSRSSRDLFALLEREEFKDCFFEFVDSIPIGDVAKLGSDMVAHWMSARNTALPMESRHGGAQKKTEDSDGSSRLSAERACPTDGVWTLLCTIFRWLRFSR